MLHRNTWFYRCCIAVFFSLFIIYNINLYVSNTIASSAPLSKQAMHGQELWQHNNCFSCHQLYGLGGYLGPDLTNVYSESGKGEDYIKAFLNSGVKTMPNFNFSEEEKTAIVSFLKEVDGTGYFPNYNSAIHYNGWVDINTKDEK